MKRFCFIAILLVLPSLLNVMMTAILRLWSGLVWSGLGRTYGYLTMLPQNECCSILQTLSFAKYVVFFRQSQPASL